MSIVPMVPMALPLASKCVPLVVSVDSPMRLSCLFVMFVPLAVISPVLAPSNVSTALMVLTLVPPLSLFVLFVELVNSIT